MENRGRLSEQFRQRTKGFAAGTIRLFVKLPKGREEVRVLGKQMLRSGTSVAAHVREASRGALREPDESQLWLELLHEEWGIDVNLIKPLETESNELVAIFATMINRTKLKT